MLGGRAHRKGRGEYSLKLESSMFILYISFEVQFLEFTRGLILEAKDREVGVGMGREVEMASNRGRYATQN